MEWQLRDRLLVCLAILQQCVALTRLCVCVCVCFNVCFFFVLLLVYAALALSVIAKSASLGSLLAGNVIHCKAASARPSIGLSPYVVSPLTFNTPDQIRSGAMYVCTDDEAILYVVG